MLFRSRWSPKGVATDAHVPGNVPVKAENDGSWAEKAAPDVPGNGGVGAVLSRCVGNCGGCGFGHQRDLCGIVHRKDSSIGAGGLSLLAVAVGSFADARGRSHRWGTAENRRIEMNFLLVVLKLG